MKGIFYGVSTGPGDPELMTLKAVRIIESCSIIAAVRTRTGGMLALSAAEKAADMSGKTMIPLDMPMTHDEVSLSAAWESAAVTIARYLDAGEDVAMLTLGDVSVYSTCTYIADRLSAMGYEHIMCAGVTSFCAAAAAHGIPLVTGSEKLTILSAQCGDEELRKALSGDGTKVIMKGTGIHIPEDSEIYAAERCGLDGERLFRGEIPSDCGYFTTVIVKGSDLSEIYKTEE